jgi:hypothetical protein
VTDARHEMMTSAEYHAHPAVGASMLETFRESRRTYFARYVAKTEPHPIPSIAMRLGTLVHKRLLEPARYAAELFIVPKNAPDDAPWDMRKKAHKQAWKDMLDAHGADDAVDDALAETVELIAASVLGNWHARTLLMKAGEPEFPIFWTDQETGLDLKCMVDWWSKPFPIDIKTTRNPAPDSFAKDCVTLGYHRKRAHYMAGIQAFTGEDLPLVHLAVGNQPPYACCPYEIDDTDCDGKSLGYRQWRQTLRALAECHDSGDWSEPFENQIVSLRLPGWAFSQDQYSLS